MPQSLTRLFFHIIFSTKHRQPILDETIETELWRYIAGICNGLECHPIQVGGYVDHIHILCGFSKKITIVTLLNNIKRSSSIWIKTKGERFANFHWQDGYAAITVNPTGLDTVDHYIRTQKQHHQKTNYQDECRKIYNENKISFDERYAWD